MSASPLVNGKSSQKFRLERLWLLSSRLHHLVDDGDNADIILVSDLAGPDWFSALRKNKLVNRYPDKSFAISDSDYPFPLLHGIYTSATNRLYFRSRFKSAGYNLYPHDFLNPFLSEHPGSSFRQPKKYLYSFAGRDSSAVRMQIFTLPKNEDAWICDSSRQFAAFGPSPEPKENWQENYVRVLEETKYSLCPRGVGAASLRLFESMKMGVAPVILADSWLLPEGPNWRDFAIMIPESEALKIPDILMACESEYAQRGELAQRAYEQFFAENVYFDYLIDLCVSIRNSQVISEKLFWSIRNVLVFLWKINRNILVP